MAERLGYPPDTALTLGRFVAGSGSGAKALSLGTSHDAQKASERSERAAALKPQRQVVRLLGRDVPVLPTDDGTLRADNNGKPASACGVRSYVLRAFGDRLGEVREAMGAPAASLPPEELNRVRFRLYERLRPDVPAGGEGWARKESCGLSGFSRRGRDETSGPDLLMQFAARARMPKGRGHPA